MEIGPKLTSKNKKGIYQMSYLSSNIENSKCLPHTDENNLSTIIKVLETTAQFY